MAEVIRMPKMSDTMEEGVIAAWLKKVGDSVKPGDILAEVETDKATMELESYEEGVLLHIGVKEKDSVPVNGIIAVIGEKGEDFEHLLKDNGGSDEKKEEAPKAEEKKTEEKKSGDKPKKSSEKIDTSNIDATVITMPKMSDTMQEGTIAAWLKKVGDSVKSGEIIAEVETDKATMELESYEDGTLLYIGVEEGDSVPVDGVIAVIGAKDADYETLLKAQEQSDEPEEEKQEDKEEKKAAEPKKSEESKSSSNSSVASPSPVTSDGDRVKASPLAKKIAEEKGIDIRQVAGSGDGGRIIKRDVENFVPTAAPAASASASAVMPSVGQESFTEEKVSQMRKVIAKRLAESKYSAPHFYLTMEINMDKAIEARKSMNEVSPVKISFNDMVIKASAAALRQHPKVNSSWLGDKIRYNDHIHIGMAVAVEEGLLVPVIRFADSKSLSQISNEAKTLGGKAKNKELQPKDWEGNTFTISNLGMFGIDEFTAIINPPDACILAVGGIKETVIVKDGQMKIGNIMKVTLSCDHRVVDGAVGSAFLLTLKGLLEDPVRILI
ncbi:MAG TPA: pyruvate dehydrogenase complex dihydrolipoamide acetyltransferase [Algoriphagus sp.]|jgi:pyruvate dehydrogenase E2 component (dihydrolipoamide acetyltransferase)|uniref:pyruvate dehydrogenase complex dihydrolipoamide acetyltransferase n=1 Tax=unclassified Algoriphagus TaxID=2641541 RepID=UPI000C373562|nr:MULTISPECIES: pyruvate dehydrogenase complex dihydrolipoamide acetyltransferase [unclassified Algoriphagus]MAL14504.1 pyruvate dehydrogenase complex dihydrolipoamide acetyltransferase [Algoriphagus sp.]HAD52813.1 pyruvate dehydrogenase complex dihydrolipoamide acetyltransferase [Algoriphagus sp.]HAS57456.1 pyruvate dehydrogenase complex dihydrolipoamide acetyltransferase [Algoriphagus sp.]HAZ23858.1 pyruvate dehydrogenase complex dihydrolipoamide acetyltransferase [Algoriphagus sp.]HCD89918|tara:strand:- start:15859 stop:17517 length:1659 start_codon:yes stop_codon:yes gene_type:complete